MKTKLCTLFAFLTLLVAASANAQLSQSTTVSLSATVGESLSLSCTPSSVTLTGTPLMTSTAPVSCTTTYVLAATRSKLMMQIYLASAVALSSGANTITNAQLAASEDSSPYNSCVSTDAYSSFGCDASSGYALSSAANPNGSGWPSGSRVDTINFQITPAAEQAVGTYSGTVNITVTAS